MQIGDVVRWITYEYYSGRHPDEVEYTPVNHTGTVISFDDNVCSVWTYTAGRNGGNIEIINRDAIKN